MNKQEIYDLINKLGMVEEVDTPTDLPSVMNFVDTLFIYNDEATIKKFLVCLLYKKEEE